MDGELVKLRKILPMINGQSTLLLFKKKLEEIKQVEEHKELKMKKKRHGNAIEEKMDNLFKNCDNINDLLSSIEHDPTATTAYNDDNINIKRIRIRKYDQQHNYLKPKYTINQNLIRSRTLDKSNSAKSIIHYRSSGTITTSSNFFFDKKKIPKTNYLNGKSNDFGNSNSNMNHTVYHGGTTNDYYKRNMKSNPFENERLTNIFVKNNENHYNISDSRADRDTNYDDDDNEPFQRIGINHNESISEPASKVKVRKNTNPMHTLENFAIFTQNNQGSQIQNSHELRTGNRFSATLFDGSILLNAKNPFPENHANIDNKLPKIKFKY